MKRIPEPELMLEEEQARAYAQADFEEPHNRFIELFGQLFPEESPQHVLDLGCGPADISVRFARAYPGCTLHSVDGSQAMLKLAKESLAEHRLVDRIRLIHQRLPGPLPSRSYDAVISNALLHHLQDPQVLWRTIKECGKPASPVLVMDLVRPDSRTRAQEVVQTYAASEAEILQRDFFRSLLSAYRPEEVQAQLKKADLEGFRVEIVGDRHFMVYGRTADPEGSGT